MFPTENKNENILGTVNEFVETVNRQCDIAIRRISICPREVIGDDLKQMSLALLSGIVSVDISSPLRRRC